MADKHVSYSELVDWHTCPYRHKLLWLDKVRPFEANVHFSFGTAVHNTLEKYLQTPVEFDVLNQYFKEQFLNELMRMKNEDLREEKNKKLIAAMKEVGGELVVLTDKFLKKTFGNYKILGREDQLYEPLEQFEGKHFKGFIDLVIQDEEGIYHIIDYKTTSTYWDKFKRSDKKKLYQLMFYKKFYAQKYGIDLSKINVHFILIKWKAKSKQIEVVSPTSGPKRLNNATEFLSEAIQNIQKGNYLKRKNNCKWCYLDRDGFCKKNSWLGK